MTTNQMAFATTIIVFFMITFVMFIIQKRNKRRDAELDRLEELSKKRLGTK